MHKNIPLVVGITILFLGTCINPSIAIDNAKRASMPISNGNTLYVGGTGEGNYTKIQDAIDNASDGDTVFVYDDSSPYYENIKIKNSINLIGENSSTTIIEGENSSDYCILLIFCFIKISGFTIQNCSSGIAIGCEYNTISDNIIKNNRIGIEILFIDKNTIKNNVFANNYWGIYLQGSDETTIENNYIFSNSDGIYLSDSFTNNITNNLIFENDRGVDITNDLDYSHFNLVKCNNISNNRCGISIHFADYAIIENNNFYHNNWTGLFLQCRGCTISKNNFIENGRNAYFSSKFYFVRKNKWNNNYWSDYKGKFGFPKIIIGDGFFSMIPRIDFDWHPAKVPNDIEV